MDQSREIVRESRLFASEHRGRSWWSLISTLAAFIAAIAVACLDISWLIRVPASVLAALLHVRLFTIYHDYQHGAILRGSRIADLFFSFYGLVALAPASMWKHTHDHHHGNNCRRFGIDTIGTFPVMTVDGLREAPFRHRLFWPSEEWDFAFAALRSSSFIRANPLMHWFTGNIGYHHVHHLNSRIPFYRLPEAMAAIEGLQSPGTTSLSPKDIVRCLRLHLWDPDQDRFVSFREARRIWKTRSASASAA